MIFLYHIWIIEFFRRRRNMYLLLEFWTILFFYKLFCRTCSLSLQKTNSFKLKTKSLSRLIYLRISIHLFFTLLEPVENQLKTSTPLFIVRPQNSLLWLFGGDKRIWNDLYGGRKEQRWRVWHSSQIRNRKEEEMDREYKAWQTKRKI